MFLADEKSATHDRHSHPFNVFLRDISRQVNLTQYMYFFVAILVASWNKICKAHECVQLNVSSLLPGFAVEE